MTYTVKDSFRTIQGEGYHAGTPALFVRFAGCNMWSGDPAHRARDAERNAAECPKWCDTDFVGGMKFTAEQLGELVHAQRDLRLVVLTGGEPMLQLDDAALEAIHAAAPLAKVAIETNGTVAPRFRYRPLAAAAASYVSEVDRFERSDLAPWLWFTLSPKRARTATVLTYASELKLVTPAYRADDWDDFAADHMFLQPQAFSTGRDTETEQRVADVLTMLGGRWRLSLQTHKILGVP